MNEIVYVGLGIIIIIFFIYRNAAVSEWYKVREDGKFCESCGTPTYITKIRKGYDSKTGKPIEEDYRACRNAKYGKVDDHLLSYDM